MGWLEEGFPGVTLGLEARMWVSVSFQDVWGVTGIIPGYLLLQIGYLAEIGEVLGIGLWCLRWRCRVPLPQDQYQCCRDSIRMPTLLNQSDISDFTEKSFSNCCCISRAASLALLSSEENEGFSISARVPHHVRSCRIRRGSGSPLSMCL